MRIQMPIQTSSPEKPPARLLMPNRVSPVSTSGKVGDSPAFSGHSLGRFSIHDPKLRENGGSGEQIPQPIRKKMESSFGQDFSSIRTHEDESASAIGALAYTRGEHIHFKRGKRQWNSHKGRQLLGHELAHVVQQRLGRVAVPQGAGFPINADDHLEAEAEALGRRAASGRSVGVGESTQVAQHRSAGASSAPIQCNGDDEDRRAKLSQSTAGLGHLYGRSVFAVNQFLRKQKAPLSRQAYERISANTQAVESGQMSQPTAHLSEMATFTQEAWRQPWGKKRWALAGIPLNFLGFLASGAIEANKRKLGRS